LAFVEAKDWSGFVTDGHPDVAACVVAGPTGAGAADDDARGHGVSAVDVAGLAGARRGKPRLAFAR